MTEAQGIKVPQIKYTTAIPDKGRGKGRTGSESIYRQIMVDMPAPAPGKGKGAAVQYAWFFVAAEVPPTITDPAEREAAAKDEASKLVNKFTQVSRRIRKTQGATHDYTFRKVRDPEAPEGTGDWGLVVYRIEPGAAKAGPQRKAA